MVNLKKLLTFLIIFYTISLKLNESKLASLYISICLFRQCPVGLLLNDPDDKLKKQEAKMYCERLQNVNKNEMIKSTYKILLLCINLSGIAIGILYYYYYY